MNAEIKIKRIMESKISVNQKIIRLQKLASRYPPGGRDQMMVIASYRKIFAALDATL